MDYSSEFVSKPLLNVIFKRCFVHSAFLMTIAQKKYKI